MKWLFLMNDAQFLMEFLGKICDQLIKEGDECMVTCNSKIAEYGRKQFFSGQAKFISKVNWCRANYSSSRRDFGGLTWREFFPIYERFGQPNGGVDFTYERSLDAISQQYQFFEHIFAQEKPDAVVSEPPAGLFHEVAYYFAKTRNVPYLGFIESRINGRIDLYDSESTCSLYRKEFEKIRSGLAPVAAEETQFVDQFLEKFVSHEERPAYVQWLKISFGPIGFVRHYLERIRHAGYPIVKYLANQGKFKQFDYESEFLAWYNAWSPFRVVKRNVKILFQRGFFNKVQKGDQYLLFPMQLEPEASTLVMATYYADQVNVIKKCAFSLPLPYKLYVKEHPDAIGTKPNSFYWALAQLPNVVIVPPEAHMPSLIRNSAGVITPTSTVGMEAVLSGKPAYILGDVFYEYHPLIRKAINFNDLQKKIADDIGKQTKAKKADLHEINGMFMVSYLRHTIPGSIIYSAQENDKNNYAQICLAMRRFLHTMKNGGYQ